MHLSSPNMGGDSCLGYSKCLTTHPRGHTGLLPGIMKPLWYLIPEQYELGSIGMLDFFISITSTEIIETIVRTVMNILLIEMFFITYILANYYPASLKL